MSKGKVSEKMQRAVRKLQRQMSNPNNQQQQHDANLQLSADEASPRAALRKRSSLKSDHGPDHGDASPTPSDVPEGFLAVYVGSERQRFVIDANYLKHQRFKLLLDKSAEEYGFEHKGGLPIACDVASFEHLLCFIKSNNPAAFQLAHCSCFSIYAFPR